MDYLKEMNESIINEQRTKMQMTSALWEETNKY